MNAGSNSSRTAMSEAESGTSSLNSCSSSEDSSSTTRSEVSVGVDPVEQAVVAEAARVQREARDPGRDDAGLDDRERVRLPVVVVWPFESVVCCSTS